MKSMRSACSRPVVASSLAFAPAAQRRVMQKAMVHMAYQTPAQFSSFYGAKMLLPECYVRRAKMAMISLRKPAQMSFLGVGAPEAILVAIVALVVFGPKGLADAAKSVGQTLRTFQPTIKEVVAVSQDLKATLDKELGIDELRQAARPEPRMQDTLQPVTEDVAREMDPEIEKKRAEAAKLAWGESITAGQEAGVAAAAAAAPAVPAAPAVASTPAVAAAGVTKDLASMSMDDLEAELARRKAGSGKA